MNRFAHENIDHSITMQRRLLVMTKTVGPTKMKWKKPTGYDKYVGARLRKRLWAYEHMDARGQTAATPPGSMNRQKGG